MFNSILVPIDLADTDLAKPAIATASTLSQMRSGTVRLLNVLPMTPVMLAEYVPADFDEQQRQNQQALLNSPSLQSVREYPDNNPLGLRWMEHRLPGDTGLPEGWNVQQEMGAPVWTDPQGNRYFNPPESSAGETLRKGLEAEGDAMDHCVGGYCTGVEQGTNRIFSLRDAEGHPHVTIETAPSERYLPQHIGDNAEEDAFNEAADEGMTHTETAEHVRNARQAAEQQWYDANPSVEDLFNQHHYGLGDPGGRSFQQVLREDHPDLPQEISQIKGKSNSAPLDKYMPFVHDFIQNMGDWTHVGDWQNAKMLRTPTGRITNQQYSDAVGRWAQAQAPDDPLLAQRMTEMNVDAPPGMHSNFWNELQPHIQTDLPVQGVDPGAVVQGFAKGGPVIRLYGAPIITLRAA